MASFLFTFDGPDTTSGVPVPEGYPALVAVSGEWHVTDGRPVTSTPRESNPILAATVGLGTIDISADVGSAGDAVYIRVQDANNWIRARTDLYTVPYTYEQTQYLWWTPTYRVSDGQLWSSIEAWCPSNTQPCPPIGTNATFVQDGYQVEIHADEAYFSGQTRQVPVTTSVYQGGLYLEKCVDGVITALGSDTTTAVQKVRIRAGGTSVQVFKNGASSASISATVQEFATVAQHGVGRAASNGDTSALDNLTIDPLTAPPYAPLLVAPLDGATINRHEPYRLKWQFDDPDIGDYQTAYELQYRMSGTSTWTTIGWVTSQNTWWDAPAETFSAGEYEWQVATKDRQGNASLPSVTGFFTAGDEALGPAFTDQVDPAILTGPVQEWDYGVDLLDSSGVFIADISGDVTDMQVSYDTHAVLHGDCRLSLTRDLTWGVDRVRPWIAVRDKETSPWYRWNLGVFVPTSPEGVAGETPRIRDVQAYDLLWLLQREIGDTYVVQAGVYYLDAIETVLEDAGVTATLYLQGNRWSTTLTEPAVWVLGGGYTWLDVINDLLGMIGYERLWADREGRLRSAPYLAPANRPTVWRFDSTDVLTSIMSEDRRLSADVFDAPNLWRFVRNKDEALTSNDVYVVDHTAGLPAYQVRPKTVYVDAVDRDALEAEGDRIVTEDTAIVRTVEFDITPLPLAHGDIVELFDPKLDLSVRGLVAQLTVGPDSEHLTLEVV